MKQIPFVVYILAGAGVLALFLVLSLFGEQGFIAVYKARQEKQYLIKEIDESKQMIDSLKLEIERLKSDTVYIERVAREKLGMARRNEKVFKFIEGK